jgi:predicted Zn finger-like uncharacterized protein
MDVRCEKCQTEYELDEARLKPGGVTVKCTNCGHMFKIRKRSITNVGAPPPEPPRGRPASAPPARPPARPAPSIAGPSDEAPTNRRADSVIGDPLPRAEGGDDRHWLIRLENGEQKSCRELSALQQWIVGGIVTRESLISRSGKTWKRLGDIAELAQYFNIADEAQRARQERSTKPQAKTQPAGTMLGVGVSAAGGTILPDDDDEIDRRTTGSFKAKPDAAAAPAARRPPTQPPPPPAKKPVTAGPPTMGGTPQVPAGGRATAAWASADIAPTESMSSMPAGPMAGKIRTHDDEPAFAGRVRMAPTDETGFDTGRVRSVDDDDDVVPQQRGGKGGFLLVLMALLVMGAAAGAIYVFVIKKDTTAVATGSGADAGSAVVADAAVVATADATAPPPVVDAAAVQTALDLAHEKLEADKEIDLRDALKSIEGSTEPGADAMRANVIAGIAQGMLDRAVLVEKSDAEKLKKDAKALVLEAATPAQKAVKATPDDPAANLAMAAVLRLQGKSVRDVARYLEPATAKATPAWKRDIAIGQALALEREKKYDEAKAILAPLDASAEDKLEATGDVRVRFRLAMIAFAQNKPADAKPLVESILAAAPDHRGAKALAAKIDNTVVKTDPLPPEDGQQGSATKPPEGGNTGGGNTGGGNVSGGGSYDQLLARANALAESNCTKAIDLFGKALEQKPNGVEALTGMGYCHIDAKQFASAFSKFRAALAVSSRYEPALWGIAEAYMQQGRKEQALEAVKAYIDVYPGVAKAQKALDRLGGATPAPTPTPTPPDNGGGSATPPPTPTPTPTPEAPAAGSGTSN